MTCNCRCPPHGQRGYVGQEVTWNLIVRNPGKVPLENVVVRASLPAEVRFVKASDGGRVMGRNVVWDLGTAPAQREWPLTVTGVCDRLSAKSALSATVSGRPPGDRSTKSIGPERPVESAFEIIGIPALQMSVKNSNDPNHGRATNDIHDCVKNAGTLAASKVIVSGQVPEGIKKAGGEPEPMMKVIRLPDRNRRAGSTNTQ